MIFPEPRKDRLHQKGLAFLSTLVFAVLGFVFLTISDLEVRQASREVFRQIDMSSLMPRSLRLGGSVDYEGTESQNSVQLIGTAQDENDPTELPVSEGVESEGEGNDEESGETGANGDESESSRDPIDQPVPEDPVSNSSSEEVQQEPEEQNTPPPSTEPPETSSAPPSQNTSPTYSNATESSSSPATSAEGGLAKLSLESFGSDYADLEVREIINWMKSNPGELPKGVRQLVRFRPAFLSSVTSFTMEGKQYELYLMCKESLFEVHVVLVEQNEATYLVDRSFQKLTTYLRKGQVRRTNDNQIIAVRSNMASNDSSEEFYSLFLSWWQWAKNS